MIAPCDNLGEILSPLVVLLVLGCETGFYKVATRVVSSVARTYEWHTQTESSSLRPLEVTATRLGRRFHECVASGGRAALLARRTGVLLAWRRGADGDGRQHGNGEIAGLLVIVLAIRVAFCRIEVARALRLSFEQPWSNTRRRLGHTLALLLRPSLPSTRGRSKHARTKEDATTIGRLARPDGARLTPPHRIDRRWRPWHTVERPSGEFALRARALRSRAVRALASPTTTTRTMAAPTTGGVSARTLAAWTADGGGGGGSVASEAAASEIVRGGGGALAAGARDPIEAHSVGCRVRRHDQHHSVVVLYNRLVSFGDAPKHMQCLAVVLVVLQVRCGGRGTGSIAPRRQHHCTVARGQRHHHCTLGFAHSCVQPPNRIASGVVVRNSRGRLSCYCLASHRIISRSCSS